MASPGQYQGCGIQVNVGAVFFRLVLAMVLGMTVVVAAHTAQAQRYTVIHNFMGGADGEEPAYGLTIDSTGTVYGSTFEGDAGTGTIFQLANPGTGWTLNTLYMFTGGNDGAVPYAGVVFGPDGTLYGTTAFGGIQNPACTTGGGFTGCGTVFNLKSPSPHPDRPSTAWTESVLYAFTGNTDGATPYGAQPVFDAAGNLYSTAFGGGTVNQNCPAGCGVVYQLVPSQQGGWTQSVLYRFSGPDGASPWAGVIFDQAGNLYGTTKFGGAYGQGTVYQLTPAGSGWTEKVLYSFQNNPQDGGLPYAGLIFDQAGNLYGATTNGGANGGGTVFELAPSGSGWSYQTLYAFTGQAGQFAHGPTASLIMDAGGNLYGAAAGDGAYGKGSVFKLAPSGGGWMYTSLYDFMGLNDGQTPRSNLVFDKYGNLYGTATGGPSSPNCGGGGGQCGLVFEITFPMQYVAVSPCRLVDTRSNGGPIQGGTSRTMNLPQLAQAAGCTTLSSASVYSLNVTVVPHGPLGYLTVWPAGQKQPAVSTLNSLDGRVKANAAIVPAGAAAAVSVFASNTTDVVLDIDGYFAPAGQSTLAFYHVPPCRVADTRSANGALGGPYLSGGAARDFPVLQSSCLPKDVTPGAYSFNFTVVPHVPLGYLTVWPAGQLQPGVSTLNAPTGTTTANAAIVQAGTGGDIEVFPSNDTDLVIDVNGYFAPPGVNGLSLYAAPPCRVLDTRGGNGAFVGELTVDVVDSVCSPPSTAQAYVFNATVVPSGPLGYLTLWPDPGSQPSVSTLNAIDGSVTSNMAIVQTIDGSVDAYASNLTQLILDISSYFAP